MMYPSFFARQIYRLELISVQLKKTTSKNKIKRDCLKDSLYILTILKPFYSKEIRNHRFP